MGDIFWAKGQRQHGPGSSFFENFARALRPAAPFALQEDGKRRNYFAVHAAKQRNGDGKEASCK
jgi:hypothetical protein